MKRSDRGNNLPRFPLPERSPAASPGYSPLLQLWREMPADLRWGLILLALGVGGVTALLKVDPPYLATYPWIENAAWCGLSVLLLGVTHRSWRSAFGPVLYYDLLRVARQGRAYVLREVYGLALLVVLFFVYSGRFGRTNLFGDQYLSIDDLSRFAESFFTAFLAVQLGAVVLLTPVYAGTAIAEERERKTLDDLLATHLLDGEIVIGKLLSRLLTLFLFLTSGLPILSLLQLLGGVDPNLVLAAFVVTAATVVSIGSLGVYNSVRLRDVRSAVIATYVQVGIFLVVTTLAGACCFAPFGTPRTATNPARWLSPSNPILVYEYVMTDKGTNPTGGLVVVRDYVIVQGAWTLLFVGLATRSLRIRSAGAERFRQREPEGSVLMPQNRRPRKLPRVGDDPIFWKEYHASTWSWLPTWLMPWLILCGTLLVFCGMVTFIQILMQAVMEERSAIYLKYWVIFFSVPILCVGYLAVAVRSAITLSGERERGTLDPLLTTPVENRTILGSKWWGNLLSLRVVWGTVAGVWILGVFTGGVHPLSLVLLLLAGFIYADFVARIGMWYSLRCRTMLRATVWTLVTLFALSVIPPLLLPSWFPDWVRHSLSPPMTLVHLTFGWNEGVWQSGLLFFVPVLAYAGVAQGLRLLTEDRFGALTGRMSDEYYYELLVSAEKRSREAGG
jgi:ABC-type transport system involved in multi-copper enzyme maturation permease subunit